MSNEGWVMQVRTSEGWQTLWVTAASSREDTAKMWEKMLDKVYGNRARRIRGAAASNNESRCVRCQVITL
jgi:hypothetical protein